MSELYKILDGLSIQFQKYEHQPVFTTAESSVFCKDIPGTRVKNLFLRNPKGDKHYLVTLATDKQADLKKLAEALGERRLGFASPERLMQYLKISPGSVSPLCLINDSGKKVIFCFDKDLRKSEKLGMHPNNNAGTLLFSFKDFEKFLQWWGGKVIEVNF